MNMFKSVTLGDEEASRRGGQKTVLERKGPSTFTCGAEIISKTELQVHRNLEATVDALLAGSLLTLTPCPSQVAFQVIIIFPCERTVDRKTGLNFLFCTGRSPIFEVCKIDPKGSTHENLHIETESSNEIDSNFEDYVTVEDSYLRKDEMTTNNMFNLDFAGKLAEGSCEARAGIQLFIYGVRWLLSILQS